MVVWGGLRPILSRLALDVATLLSLTLCALTEPDATNAILLALACSITIVTAGWTRRWTVSYPLVPLASLQLLRRVGPIGDDGAGWASTVIFIGSMFWIVVSAALTVLFPAVRLSRAKGRHWVGVIDLHLPVGSGGGGGDDGGLNEEAHVTARLLYPTDDDRGGTIPYLNEDVANEICDELMNVGAPPPLKKLGWMLHTWQLTRIEARRHATPCRRCNDGDGGGGNGDEEGRRLPLAVYSHGLTGNASIYSYQALNLASHGTVVLQVDHTDGSAIGVKRRDGSFLRYDSSLHLLEREGQYVEYVRKRRRQADHRVDEILAAADALKRLNERDVDDLVEAGISFVGKLDVSDLTFIGHSFGGCSALAAAARTPELATCVVAHEPTIDWMPDDGRRALFAAERLAGSSLTYDGGTGGYEELHGKEEEKKWECGVHEKEKERSLSHAPEQVETAPRRSSFHDVDILFLYSHEWQKKGWGNMRLLQGMHRAGKLGAPDGLSEVGFVYNSHHSEFSDSCMMTPTWLARGTGLTGSRNPHETAEEIAERTLDFIRAVRKRRHGGGQINR